MNFKELFDTSKNKDEYFQEKLKEAEKKWEKQNLDRRIKNVRGFHLLEKMIGMADNKTYTVDKKSVYYKITGASKDKKLYVSINGGRVDLNGFSIEEKAIREIGIDVAKKKHLGRTKAQLDFSCNDEEIMIAYKKALEELNKG